MRLVDEGKLTLEDHAYEHIDPAMKRMWNVTMASLFGERAHKVTIRHLLTMRSGIADYEQGDFDLKLLENTPNITHSPLENLQTVANFSAPAFCQTNNCTWMFEPGTHGDYSSTNFILAGLLLLKEDESWEQLDMKKALGILDDYDHTFFVTEGPAN